MEEMTAAPLGLKTYLQSQFRSLLADPYIDESVGAHLDMLSKEE